MLQLGLRLTDLLKREAPGESEAQLMIVQHSRYAPQVIAG